MARCRLQLHATHWFSWFLNFHWLQLLSFVRNQDLTVLCCAAGLATVSGVIDPIIARLLGLLFRQFTLYSTGDISVEEFSNYVPTYVLGLVCLACSSLFLNGCFYASWICFGELQTKNARMSIFHGMIRRRLNWFEREEGGVNALCSRLQRHFHDFAAGTSQSLGLTLQALVSAIAALSLAFYMAWDLTLVTLSIAPLAAIGLSRLSDLLNTQIAGRSLRIHRAACIASVAIGAIDSVKVFGTEMEEVNKYDCAIKAAAYCYRQEAHLTAIQAGLGKLITLVMFVPGFWYGIYIFVLGWKNPDQILTTFWACMIALQSTEHVVSRVIILQQGKFAAISLTSLSYDGNIDESCGRSGHRPATSGHLEINDLSFSYSASHRRMTLEHINMAFPTHRMTFVIGKSGSGKSTIARLLIGLCEPVSGDILLEGESLCRIPKTWLRDQITVVPHDPEIFDGTISENLQLARCRSTLTTKSQLSEALNFAGLGNFIDTLPDGIDTKLGVQGISLSGGQRQRLGLAQAWLRDTPVLLLDEATSAIDPQGRTEIFHRIRTWRKDKSTIIISHDVTQISKIDYVYVLARGCIVDEGPWDTLHGLGGDYVFKSYDSKHFENDAHNSIGCIEPSNHEEDFPLGSSTDVALRNTPSISCSYQQKRQAPSLDLSRRRHSMVPGRVVPISPAMLTPTQSMYDASGPRRVRRQSCDESQILSPLYEYHANFDPLVQEFESRRSETGTGRNDNTPLLTSLALEHLPLRRIFASVWPVLSTHERASIIVSVGIAMVHGLATPLFAYIFAKLLTTFELANSQRWAHGGYWTKQMLTVAVVDSAATYALHYLLEISAQAWVDAIRVQAFWKVLRQPRAWFDTAGSNTSDLTSCLDECAEDMRTLLSSFAPSILTAVWMVTAACAWSLLLCWRLTLVGLLMALLMYLVSWCFENMCQVWDERKNDAARGSAALLSEIFTKIRAVKAFNLESHFTKLYKTTATQTLKIGCQRGVIAGLFVGIMDASMVLTQALVFWTGVVLVTSYDIPVATITSVFSMLLFSISNAGLMISQIPQVGSAQVAASRLLGLSRLPSNARGACDDDYIIEELEPIVFRDFNLAYETKSSEHILQSLNLRIGLGGSVGLVGPSGCGKTTILYALLGLYAASSEGESLTFGGRPISNCDLQSLRALVGYVPQRVMAFPDTIARNITYGMSASSPMATATAVEAAARAVGIDTFIESLSEGYETTIGEGGLGLSAGQIQRIGIARAIVRQPKLLIMDEPTSNLDPEASDQVRCCVQKLVQRGTTVVVATHAAAMMQAMDRLVVIEGGRATDEGNWDELIIRDGSRLREMFAASSEDQR